MQSVTIYVYSKWDAVPTQMACTTTKGNSLRWNDKKV